MHISAIQNNQNQVYLTSNKQKYLQTRAFDKVTFSGGFSKLERQALEAVRTYAIKNNLETCRIIKNGKDITSYFHIIETESACKPSFGFEITPNILKTISNLFSYKRAMKNSTCIHSHTNELPLSPQDIFAAIHMKYKKMASITPEGKYMSVELDKISRKKVKELIPSLFDKVNLKYNKMTTTYGSRFVQEDNAHMQEYSNFMLDALKDFFEKTGLKVETNFY